MRDLSSGESRCFTVSESWTQMREQGAALPSALDSLAKQCLRDVMMRSVASISEQEIRSIHARLYSVWGSNTADHAIRALRSAIEYGKHATPKPVIKRAPGDIQRQAKYRVRADRKKVLLKVPTVGEVFEEYLSVRNLQWNTAKNYRYNFQAYLADWMMRPIDSFRKAEVMEKHRTITRTHGPSVANTTLRIFRALCNYAMAVCEDDGGEPMLRKNPATVLKEARIWNPDPIRTRQLQISQMREWFSAVRSLPNPTSCDFLTFLLFTGCRQTEASNLKWADVSLEDGFVLFRRTKNGHPHKLPVSSQVLGLLRRRREMYGGFYVFAQSSNPYKPYNYKHSTTKRIEEICGILISPHDLRRGYAGLCFMLRMDTLLISRLLNHSPFRGGVTGRYISRSLDPFRPEIQKVGDIIEGLISGQKILFEGGKLDHIKLIGVDENAE
ncbi:MAG TPA: site-specific integrase [Oculatellaceae cyanobacterium]